MHFRLGEETNGTEKNFSRRLIGYAMRPEQMQSPANRNSPWSTLIGETKRPRLNPKSRLPPKATWPSSKIDFSTCLFAGTYIAYKFLTSF
jgi:hypothetical protein